MKKLKISFNAPVVLTFGCISLVALILNYITVGMSNQLLFMTYHSSFASPFTYLRFFTHVLGHESWSHYIGQQVMEGMFIQDNISNMSHILGGIVGAWIGYQLNKKAE